MNLTMAPESGSAVAQLAKRVNRNIPQIDEAWEKAKNLVAKQEGIKLESLKRLEKSMRDRFWGKVSIVTRNMLGAGTTLVHSSADLEMPRYRMQLSSEQMEKAKAWGAAYLVIMPAADFLRLSVAFDMTTSNSIEDIFMRAEKGPDEIDVNRSSMPPWLNVDPNIDRVVGHNGRHRAMTMLKANFRWYPAVIIMSKQTGWKNKGSKNAERLYHTYRQSITTGKAWGLDEFPPRLMAQFSNNLVVDTTPWFKYAI